MVRRLFLNVSALLILMMMIATSCIQEDTIGGGLEEGTQITFSLQLPGVQSPATRALEAIDEEKVETADVYVFDNAGILVDIGYGRSLSDQSTPNENIRHFSVTLQKAEDRDIMVLTNARRIIQQAYPAGVPLDGTLDKDRFRREVIMELPATGWNATPGSPDYVSIPMWGERTGINIDGSTSLTGAGSIKITRMMARVNVALGSTLATTKFKLSSVRVYNYNRKGCLIPDEDAVVTTWEDATPYADKPTIPQSAGWEKGPLLYSQITDDRYLKGEIYLFEAQKGISPSDGDFIKNPCIVVGGYFNGSSEETFYRIDIARKENGTAQYLHLLRNNSYNITITDVNGPGKPTYEEAYNTLPINISVEVIAWNDNDMNDIGSDGHYQLTVDKSHFLFYDEGRPQTMKIYTDYPYGWKAEEVPSWVTLTPDADNSGAAVVMEIKPEHINVSAPMIPAGDTLRYSFWITAGSMRKEVKIEQVNQPELTLTVEPDRLVFQKGAPNAKTVTVTVYPESSLVQIAETPGPYPVLWRPAGGFPVSGIMASGTYSFHPQAMPDGSTNVLSSFVTFYISNDLGEPVRREVTIMQLVTDILFNASTVMLPYGGGTGRGAGVYFTVNSGAAWRVREVLDPHGMVGSYNNQDYEAGTDVLYEFNATPNPLFEQRSATFTVESDDEEFTDRSFVVTQNFRSPYLNLSAPSIHLGSDANGNTGSVTVTSNTRWSYIQSSNWSSVFASASPSTGSTAGSASAALEDQTAISFIPRVYGKDNNTPAPQTFTATLSLTSENHLPQNPATASFSVTRTVPTLWEKGGLKSNTISGSAGGTITVTASSNAVWGISAEVTNGTGTKIANASAGIYQSREVSVDIPVNNSWKANAITVTYTGAGSGVVGSYSQTPAYNFSYGSINRTDAPAEGCTYTITYSGNFPSAFPLELLINGTVNKTVNCNPGTTSQSIVLDPNNSASSRTIIVRYKNPNPETVNYSNVVNGASQPVGPYDLGTFYLERTDRGPDYWSTANSSCPNGWRLPSETQAKQIVSAGPESFGMSWLTPSSSNQGWWTSEYNSPRGNYYIIRHYDSKWEVTCNGQTSFNNYYRCVKNK